MTPAAPCRTLTRATVLNFPEPELVPPEGRVVISELPSFPIATLNPTVEWQRECEVSGTKEKFIAYKQCELGLIGCCTHCGEERIAQYTHTNGGGE